MTASSAPTKAKSPPIDHDEEVWAEVGPLVGGFVKNPPSDDAPIANRMRFVDFVAQRARRLVDEFPTEEVGAPARALLIALEKAHARHPQAIADPKGASQTVRAAARLAADLATDPSAADRIDLTFVAGLDVTLGGPGRPLAQYHADIDVARERLAEACEERLARIPVEWRRQAGAPTRAERAQLEAISNASGMDLS